MSHGSVRHIRPRFVSRLVAAVGGTLLTSSTPAVALERHPVPPAGTSVGRTAPPWDRPGRSMGSPPHPPRRPMPGFVKKVPVAHPAVHGRRGSNAVPPGPLFPRASGPKTTMPRVPQASPLQDGAAGVSDDLRSAMERHPAGKALHPDYRVRPGDSLWRIAEAHTTPEKVADCTQALYRRNIDVVGPNEDLVLPGQSLTIPKGCKG